MHNIMQVIGILGAGLLLLAFYNSSRKHWSTESLAYQIVNLVGAILICINTYYFGVYGPLFLNIFWALIAFNGIYKARFIPR